MTMILNWDLTPAAYIKMLVTEIGRLLINLRFPSTSVPLILNEFRR
jgi:hypothetical protein